MKTNKKYRASNFDKHRTNRLRQTLANETAKIICTEGVRDFHRAKIKASARLGNSLHGALPSNLEIESAITEFQKTFFPEFENIIFEQRQTALTIMQWLSSYSPYLFGPVLEGSVGVNNVICILVSSDKMENVCQEIEKNIINTEITERRLRMNNQNVYVPTIAFEYQNIGVEVLVLTLRQQHQNPKSKSHNHRMQRINIKALKEMLSC